MKNVKKIILCTAVLTVITASQVAFGADMVSGEKQIEYTAKVNGNTVKNHIYEGEEKNIMVPVREICDMVGYSVTWDNQEKSATVAGDKKVAKYYIGKDLYQLEGATPFTFNANAEIKNGVSYVPLMFFKQIFPLDIAAEEKGFINITTNDDVIFEKPGTYTVEKGKLFSVVLTTNSSTGFEWIITKDDKVELVKERQDKAQAEAQMVGAPTRGRWIFKVETPGEYVLKFEYLRPWESKAPANTAEYKVTVK